MYIFIVDALSCRENKGKDKPRNKQTSYSWFKAILSFVIECHRTKKSTIYL